MDRITLTPERYQELLQAERQLLDLLPEYDRMESCGRDCGPFRAMNAEALQRVNKMKEHYTPIT
jgi:hypothetical protein